MKKILIIIIILFNINVCYGVNDINNHWAYDEIVRGINNQIINGYEDDTFRPNNNIKWNEFIKILVTLLDDNVHTNTSVWYKPYINKAIELQLIELEDFDYNQLISRRNVVNILYNYINICIEDKKIFLNYENKEISHFLDKYKDLNIDDKSIIFLLQTNIILGYPNNQLLMDNYISRAEAITLINKTVDFVNNENYSYKYDENIFKQDNISTYTNYKKGEKLFLNTYIVENGRVIYNDNGRLSIYDNKESKQYNDDIIEIILLLINKDNYVLNTYVESNNCVIIAYGENKEYLDNGNSLFEIILYDNIQTNNDYKYNIRINVYKLWKELNDIKQNNKITKVYFTKFINLLKVFLSNEDIDNIVNMMKNNIEKSQSGKYYYEKVNNCYYIYL